VNRAPVLAQPRIVTLNEGATANNPAFGDGNADGEALTFAKGIRDRPYATGNDDDTWDGNGYGNVALAPGFSDSGRRRYTVSATDGSGGSDGKSFTVTVNNVNQPPVWHSRTTSRWHRATTSVPDHTPATDMRDGRPLTFAKVPVRLS